MIVYFYIKYKVGSLHVIEFIISYILHVIIP